MFTIKKGDQEFIYIRILSRSKIVSSY